MNTTKFNSKVPVLVLLVGAGFPGAAIHRAEAAAPESPAADVAATDATPLHWNFRVGDAFRIDEQGITLATDRRNKRYRNEVQLEYVWRVVDVASDGTATIVIRPERVTIHSELPLADFDTARDDPTMPMPEDTAWRAEAYESRAWVQAEFKCRVTPEGRVVSIWGAVPEAQNFTAIGFTPGDFTTLPGASLQPNATWDVELRLDGNTEGHASYWLTECKTHTGQRAYHIEGNMTHATHRGWLGSQSEFGPMISTSHFDPQKGYFIDQMTVTSGQIWVGPTEIVAVKVGTLRELTPLSEPPQAAGENGIYTFVDDGTTFHPLRLAGNDVTTPIGQTLTTAAQLQIAFHHGWEDNNRNLIPEVDELRDLTTRYEMGEAVNAIFTMTGTQPYRAHVNIVNSQGQTLTTTELLVTQGPVFHGTLHCDRLAAGVYFFEWYVNDRYVVRIPVQVFASHEFAAKQASDLATIQSALPLRVRVVVTAERASIYVNHSVVDTVPAGTVLEGSLVGNQWLYVERADGSGWIYSSDVKRMTSPAR